MSERQNAKQSLVNIMSDIMLSGGIVITDEQKAKVEDVVDHIIEAAMEAHKEELYEDSKGQYGLP